MHLFRTRPVIEQLSRGSMNAETRAHYLLASFLIFNVAYSSGLAIGAGAPWTVPGTIEAIALALVNILGIVKAFDAAGGESNKDFIAEFTCLYVPAAVTTLLAVWLPYWLLRVAFRESLLSYTTSHDQFAVNLAAIGTDIFGFLTFLASVGTPAIIFYRVSNALARIRSAKSDA